MQMEGFCHIWISLIIGLCLCILHSELVLPTLLDVDAGKAHFTVQLQLASPGTPAASPASPNSTGFSADLLDGTMKIKLLPSVSVLLLLFPGLSPGSKVSYPCCVNCWQRRMV
jgi:hypothetical protein